MSGASIASEVSRKMRSRTNRPGSRTSFSFSKRERTRIVPVAELIETVRLGGAIIVCTQCAARRELLVEDLIDSATEHEVQLHLTREQVEQVPDFVYSEFDTPLSTWTEKDLGLARERARLGGVVLSRLG